MIIIGVATQQECEELIYMICRLEEAEPTLIPDVSCKPVVTHSATVFQ